MPNINDELSQMLDPHKNTLRGVVGLTESVIKVTNRASFVWVRLLDNLSEAIQAYNRTVNPVYNLPVILKFDGTKYEIISVDANRYTQWNSVQAYLPEHGMQHSAMYGASGNDIVWIDQKQFLPLLATPTGGTGTDVVGIVPYTFRNSQGNWIFAGNTGVICPPGIMASGTTVQLLCLQDSDGMPYFKAGTPFVGDLSGTPAFLQYLPSVLNNNNDIPIAGIIRVGSGTTTPLKWDNFIDVRQFYKGYVSAPTGSSSYLETFKVSISGTLIGNANEIDFYGNFSGTMSGNKAKIYDKSLVKVYTDTTLTGDGTQGNPLHSVTGTYLVGVTTDTSLQGNGTPGNPLKLTITGSSGGNIGVIESDGSPSGTPINTLVFPVNSLVGITGTNAFIAFPMSGGSGTGDVVGPASAFDGHLAVFSGTTGKIIKDGGEGSIEIGVDGGGAVPTVGVLLDFIIPYNITITGWKIIGNVSGSIQIDLWRTNFAGFPPTVANTQTASDKPKLVGALTNTGSCTGWTVNWDAGDTIRVNIDSAATLYRATVYLSYIWR